jgi:hypothetical protein
VTCVQQVVNCATTCKEAILEDSKHSSTQHDMRCAMTSLCSTHTAARISVRSVFFNEDLVAVYDDTVSGRYHTIIKASGRLRSAANIM